MGKPEIAGPQEELAGPPRDGGPERPRGIRRGVPVACPDAAAGHQDLADPVGRRGLAGPWVDSCQRERWMDLTAADKLPVRGVRPGAAHFAPGERVAVEPLDDRLPLHRATADHHGRLGEAVAREERVSPEAAVREDRTEPFQGGGADRLRADHREVPAAEVQLPPLLGRDPAGGQLIGEIGPDAVRLAQVGDRPQPVERVLHESHRRHRDDVVPDEDRLDHPADEAHVMELRQPRHHRRRATVLELACP